MSRAPLAGSSPLKAPPVLLATTAVGGVVVNPPFARARALAPPPDGLLCNYRQVVGPATNQCCDSCEHGTGWFGNFFLVTELFVSDPDPGKA